MKKKNYETGNAKNVANFQTLGIAVKSYGIVYKPSNPRIALLALQSAYSDANAGQIAIENMLKLHRDSILYRHNLYKPVKVLATRVLRAVKTSDVDDGVIAQTKALVYKIRGERMKPLPKKGTGVVPPETTPEPPVPVNSHSVSQQSFSNIIDHYNGLIIVLTGEPNYAPNETDLTVVSLTTLTSGMKTSNDDCDTALFDYNNAATVRNKLLYAPKTGLYDLAQTTKNYVSQLFGLKSPEYKAILKIKFSKNSA